MSIQFQETLLASLTEANKKCSELLTNPVQHYLNANPDHQIDFSLPQRWFDRYLDTFGMPPQGYVWVYQPGSSFGQPLNIAFYAWVNGIKVIDGFL